MSGEARSLATFLSERLRASAGDIVADWVAWIRKRLSNPAVDSLTTRGLENHIPPVIDHLAIYLTNPSYGVREEMLAHLRIHGQMRRDQGYDVRDVLGELDGLSHLITRRLHADAVGWDGACGFDDLLMVFERLATGLRAMAFVAVAVYQETETDRRQELARRLGEFGRSIGHELRSPLHAIALSAEVLQDADAVADPDRRRQQLEVIRSAVRHAEGLLYDIDLLAMVESARSRPHMSLLPSVLASVREQLAQRARANNVTLEFADAVPGFAVETVVAQLALTNLINNAIKYADPAKPERWVKIRARDAGREDSLFVEIEVADNGLGIPQEFQSRVFQRHFRAHAEAAEGTGLGLAITQEMVVERGGNIELESEEGIGTTVRVRVRALDADAVDAFTRGEGPEALMQQSVRELLASDRQQDAEGR